MNLLTKVKDVYEASRIQKNINILRIMTNKKIWNYHSQVQILNLNIIFRFWKIFGAKITRHWK